MCANVLSLESMNCAVAATPVTASHGVRSSKATDSCGVRYATSVCRGGCGDAVMTVAGAGDVSCGHRR